MLGPVFSIEIITSLRRARYIATRVIYACTLLFALWVAYTGSSAFYLGTPNIRIVAQTAQNFFITLTFMQIGAVLLVGPAIIAGTIAQERQRRTIEYLFATDLNNSEIVLGKLGARLVHLFFIVLVGLPVVAITRMMGGVSTPIMLQAFIITLSTIAWVGSISICVSVFAPRARDGLTRAYLWLIGMLVVPGIVVALIQLLSGFTWIVDPELMLIAQMYNPFVAFSAVMYGEAATILYGPWTAVGVLLVEQLTISAVCLLWAVVSVRRVYVRDAGRPPAKNYRASVLPDWQGRSPVIGENPMLWKEMYRSTHRSRYPRVQRALTILTVCGFAIFTVWFFFYTLYDSEDYIVYALFITPAMACLGLLLLGARAGASVATEKEQETWLPLISSPLEGSQIVSAKILGTMYSMRQLVFLLLIALAPCAIHEPRMVFGIVFSLGTLIVLAAFTASLGVMISLRSGSSNRASSWTLGTLVFLGGGYMFCCVPMTFGLGSADEVVMALFMAPCSPFLLVLPLTASWGDSNVAEELYASYILGTLGYGVAAAILYSAAHQRFDEFVGRTTQANLWVAWRSTPGKTAVTDQVATGADFAQAAEPVDDSQENN